MRFYKITAFIIALALIVLPLTAFDSSPADTGETQAENKTDVTGKDSRKNEAVKVFMREDDLVLSITAEEYLIGVLAAEMLPTYHEQALCAQAVAAYTYLLYKKSEQEKSPDASLKGAYLSNDTSTHQGYLTEEERAEKWGDKADSYEKKLTKAVEAVKGKVITYEGKPIIAAFHANNCGVTQSAETVWGNAVPYLKSVNSVGDKLSPDCIKTVVLSASEFSQAVGTLQGCELSGASDTWIKNVETDENGYVQSLEIGGAKITGLKARDVLGLRSAVFTVETQDDGLRFTTQGYGHGVGMSQYGADYMARQGSTWQEILKHYYTGVEIEDYNA
ncbi:MAG: stage II sporulation protein D [Clostridia bacterium]|nr:stage II sporulation protein D [Clostridia bacterium]